MSLRHPHALERALDFPGAEGLLLALHHLARGVLDLEVEGSALLDLLGRELVLRGTSSADQIWIVCP